MHPRRLPARGRLAQADAGRWSGQALGFAAALVLAGCASYDPHPVSPSTPGDPDHPPSASIHDRNTSAPVESDVINRPATLDVNPYVQNTEPSK
jgi:hypothetical protein